MGNVVIALRGVITMESFITLFCALNGAASCWWLGDRPMKAPKWAFSQGGQAYLAIAPLVCLVIGLLALVSSFLHYQWYTPIIQFVVALVAMILIDSIFGVVGIIVGALLLPALSVVAAVWLMMAW